MLGSTLVAELRKEGRRKEEGGGSGGDGGRREQEAKEAVEESVSVAHSRLAFECEVNEERQDQYMRRIRMQ